jgi:hypothetical protein
MRRVARNAVPNAALNALRSALMAGAAIGLCACGGASTADREALMDVCMEGVGTDYGYCTCLDASLASELSADQYAFVVAVTREDQAEQDRIASEIGRPYAIEAADVVVEAMADCEAEPATPPP